MGLARAWTLLPLVLLASAAPASAAPTWLAPIEASVPGPNTSAPDIAVDAEGDAIAVWSRTVGANAIVQAARRPAGAAAFEAPQDLSAAGQDASAAHVAMDAQGNATAVWRRSNGTNFIVQAATRAAGAPAFGPPQDLSAIGQDAFGPQVAVGPEGDAVVVWQRSNGTNVIIQVVSRPAGSGTFGAPQDLSATGQNAETAQVESNAQGVAVAVWRRSNGTNFIVQAAIRASAGSAFGAPQDLSATGQNASAPQVALGDQGDATAVWQRSDGVNTIIQSAVRFSGGSFGAAEDLSAVGQNAVDPQIAIDAQGATTTVWSRSNGPNFIVQAVRRPSDGPNGPTQDLSPVGRNGDLPQVEIDGLGNAVAAWWGKDPGNTRDVIQASHRPAGAAGFGEPQYVANPSDVTQDVQLDFDGEGNATAGWFRLSGTPVVQSAVLDAAGPTLASPVIAAGGQAGVGLAYSVTPVDRWSAIASTAWDFGDGATASTDAASHAFAAAGVYNVSVTATDAVGNASTGGGTSTITAAPAGPGPGPAGPGPAGPGPASPGPTGTRPTAVPVLRQSVVASRVSGKVTVKCPRQARTALTRAAQVRVGCTIDATDGRVSLTSARDARGRTQTAQFYSGSFVVSQITERGRVITVLTLNGPLPVCTAARGSSLTPNAVRRKRRRLFGSGVGSFRTKGRYGSASVRGTVWLTEDRCDGTLVRVTSGAVTVQAFKLGRTVTVRAPRSFLAPAKKPARRRR